MKCIKCGSEEFTLHKDGIDQGGYCDAHYWQGRAHRAEAELESKGAKIMSKDTPTFQTKAVVTPYHPGMTLRQYAAIKLKVPDSGLDWLDAMIVQSRRDELAGMAMQGDWAAQGDNNGVGLFVPSATNDLLASSARFYYRMADAMIEAREAK